MTEFRNFNVKQQMKVLSLSINNCLKTFSLVGSIPYLCDKLKNPDINRHMSNSNFVSRLLRCVREVRVSECAC